MRISKLTGGALIAFSLIIQTSIAASAQDIPPLVAGCASCKAQAAQPVFIVDKSGLYAGATGGSDSVVNITTATTTAVKASSGTLRKIIVNTYIASATITIYNNTAASGTKLATLTLPSTITGDTPISIAYDAPFSTGLTIVTSGATDITVVYH